MERNPKELNPKIMQAVEQLGYRATVGDVAAQAGLNVAVAQQGLLALASEAKGHLQVAESGEVVYQFPQDFRDVLRNKYLWLQIQEWLGKAWGIVFYLIRISFGVALILSIALIAIALVAIAIAASAGRDGDSDDGGGFSLPQFWFPWDFFWIFDPYPYGRDYQRGPVKPKEKAELNFLEAVFSFLFGDGNPNQDLDNRRWRTIGSVIRRQRGAVTAEQIAPYLDELGTGYALDYEEYMLPVLTRFNGRPEVSPDGALVYHFPELQTTVQDSVADAGSAVGQNWMTVSPYLREQRWEFSRATSGQKMAAIALGGVNLVGALALGKALAGGAAALGGIVGFVGAIYGLLLAYGVGFLAIPLVRYFWIQQRNGVIEGRNIQRRQRAEVLNQGDEPLQKKLNFAKQFAAETVITDQDLIYSSDRDLIEQGLEQKDRIDAEWQRRLEQGN
jgi:hypothetical protein